MNMFASQRGSVLLSVVVAITLLAAISYMLSFQGASQANTTSGERERDRLRYVAEAGIAHARLQLAQNTSCDNFADIPTTGFAGETYTASISPKKGSPVRIKGSVDLGDDEKLNLLSGAVPAYQPPVATVLQLSKTGGQDAILDDFYPNRNYGGANYVQINSASWQQRPVLQFDLSSIPAGVKIVSAQLELLQQSMNKAGAVAVHRMTRDWVEGTRNGGGTSDGADWQTHDGTSSWAQPGGEFDATVYGVTQVSGAKSGGWVTWDIGDLVQEWVSGASPNYGLLLAGDGVVTGAKYASKDTSDPLQAPKLTIAYACECGKVCGAAPPAGKNVLLVVADAGNPSTSESDRMSLIESWGHTVALISDHASQADFDTALADADVAYIAGSGSSADVNTKLTAATVGVLSEDIGLVDELGIAEPSFVKRSTQSINVIDNTHYVTDGFGLGTLQLYSYLPQIWTVSGALAPGLQLLGETQDGGSSYPPGLAILEAGAELWGGGSAAGRRVQVPWSEGSFDINALNTDGQTIFQRAIEWGAGAGAAACESTTPLLFVVSDVASLTAEEQARKTLVESWCYTVTLIDDGASQSEYNAAATSVDAAYISPQVSASAVDGKLKAQTIGVVNEDPGLHPVFGFSTVRYQGTTNAPMSTDAGHYITAPFSGGNVTLFTSDQPSGAAVGTLPGGLVTIGSWTSGDLAPLGGLLTLNTGAAISGGGTAAGRRVQMPWDGVDGGPISDINQLSADGSTILQRSLEWAAGLELSSGMTAHWKLDDGLGTTAIDSEGGHDGTLANGPTWVAGQLGDALEFTGGTEYVDLTSDAELDDLFDGGATVMAWINPDDWGDNGYGRILDKSSSASSTGDGWAIRLNKDNDGLNFGQGFSGGRGWWRLPTGSIQLDIWQHVAIAYDANSTANDPIIYLDGSPVTVTRVDTPSGSIRSDAAINLRLGNHASGTSNTFKGIIDDVRIYNRMLSAGEVADLAAMGGGGSGGGGSGGGCGGTYADDFESNDYSGNTGTLLWTTDWLEINESDGSNRGDEIVANDGTRAVRIRDNDGGGEGVEREADLSGFNSATLNLEYKRNSLDNADDYVTVDVSGDGGTTWHQLAVIGGPDNDSDDIPASYTIPNDRLASNSRIRFLSSPDLGGTDKVWFDNIEITCTP